ncbi:MAG: ATP-binding protein [Frankiales bacterium]|nr:ATP-binding protein [Frankiales bacterium]
MLLVPSTIDGITVVVVTGPVEASDVPALVDAVEVQCATQPRGIVLDLTGVTELPEPVIEALQVLASRSRSWPHPSLALCASPSAGLGGASVHADAAQALQHVDDRSAAPRKRIELPSSPEGPGLARVAVASALSRLGLGALDDDIALVVSEMVTNAVRHGRAPVVLELETAADAVVIAVDDASPLAPRCREADDQSEGGRGLMLVDLLSTEHGVRPQPPGKTVWARLQLPGALPS